MDREPFVTDRELAERLGVSVQTIRLDRLSLGIPEARARALEVAERSISLKDGAEGRKVVGELIDLEPGSVGLSRMATRREMTYSARDVVRGHFLFGQAETLALATVDYAPGEIGLCRVKFRRPVRLGEVLIAKAQVLRRREERRVVLVQIRSGGEEVFRGKFVISPLVAEA